MFRQYYIFKIVTAIVLFTFCYTACSDKSETSEQPSLEAAFYGTSTLNWDSDGKFLVINAAGSWSITFSYPEGTRESWCSTGTNSGSGNANVWIATVPNNSEGSREVTITIQSGGTTLRLKLEQSGKQGLPPPDLTNRLELPRIENMEWFLEYTTGEFALEYSIAKKHSKWVAWRLHKGHLGSGRTDAWQFDPRIPAQYSPVRNDFSGYERGHMCPSADRNNNDPMNWETFMYSNMSPQVGAGFNQGIWATLETKIRGWVGGGDTLYVCCGGTVLKESDISSYTSPSSMAVPKYYFKVVLRKKVNTTDYDAIGFWFENRRYTETLSVTHAKTIDQIETLTGIDFFYNLPEDVQTQVESGFTPAAWGL